MRKLFLNPNGAGGHNVPALFSGGYFSRVKNPFFVLSCFSFFSDTCCKNRVFIVGKSSCITFRKEIEKQAGVNRNLEEELKGEISNKERNVDKRREFSQQADWFTLSFSGLWTDWETGKSLHWRPLLRWNGDHLDTILKMVGDQL